ncbi:MAG: hypothetical protein PHY92_08910 [Alphaproteobacteria bacterium]|nr:hypothetical protein [Alphaproteobacteria bacterium]
MSEDIKAEKNRTKARIAALAGVGIVVVWGLAAQTFGHQPSKDLQDYLNERVEQRVEWIGKPLKYVLPEEAARPAARGVEYAVRGLSGVALLDCKAYLEKNQL